MKAALNAAMDSVADTAALETYLRDDVMAVLEKSLKAREHKLKKVCLLRSALFRDSRLTLPVPISAHKAARRAALPPRKRRQGLLPREC